MGAIGFALATGSTVMSKSMVRVEMEPTPLAVSMWALVDLKQFVLVALLLVCFATMVTLQLAKDWPHRRRSAAESGRRRSFGARGMAHRGRGKRSATAFVAGAITANSMSSKSDEKRSAVAAKETGGITNSQERRSASCTATPDLSIHISTRLNATPSRVQLLDRVTRGSKQKMI